MKRFFILSLTMILALSAWGDIISKVYDFKGLNTTATINRGESLGFTVNNGSDRTIYSFSIENVEMDCSRFGGFIGGATDGSFTLKESGLLLKGRILSILNLRNGDKVKIDYKLASEGSLTLADATLIGNNTDNTFVSGTEYTISTSAESVHLDIISSSNNNYIEKITVTPYYDITVTQPTDGTVGVKVGDANVTTENTTAPAGQTITLSNTPADNYTFTSYSVTKTAGGAAIALTESSFTMPNEAVTITATFTQSTPAVTKIGSVEIVGLVSPEKGEALKTLSDLSTTTTGASISSITWSPEGKTAAASTAYTATIVLEASSGYQFASTVTTNEIAGKTATVTRTDGTHITVAYTFDETAAEQEASVSTEKTWTFESLTNSEYSELTKVGDYYIRAATNVSSTTRKFALNTIDNLGSLTFGDGFTTDNITKYLAANGAFLHSNLAVSTAGAAITDKTNGIATLAFNASVSGTCFVKIKWTGSGTGYHRVYFNNGNTTSNIVNKTATLNTLEEISCSREEAGSYFLGTVNAGTYEIYAVRFVPATTIKVPTGLTGGTVTADKASANEGEEVTLTVTPEDGYHLKEGELKAYYISTNGAETEVTITNNKFTKPAYYVYVKAEFEENSAPVITTAPVALSPTYTGGAQDLVTAGEVVGGTIYFSTTSATEGFDTAIPQETNAGSYNVWWKIVGDATHTDVAATQIADVKINQKTVTISDITASNKTYDGNTTASLDYTSLSVSGKCGEDEVSATATGAFADKTVGTGKTVTLSNLTLTGAKASNYVLAAEGQQTSTTANITALKATLTWENTSLTFDGTEKAPTAIVSNKIEGDEVNVTVTGGQTAVGTNLTATASGLTGADAGNYTLPSTNNTTTYNISSATASVTAAPTAVENLTYTGQPLALISAGTASGGTMQYSLTSGSGFSEEIPTATDAGNYTVYYKVIGDENHGSTEEASVVASIAKAAGSISYTTPSVDKTSTDGAFTNELTKTGDGTVTYSSSDTNVATVSETTGEVTIVGAGSTTITATVADGTNYSYETKTSTYTLTVTAASLDAMPVNSSTTWSFGNVASGTSFTSLTNFNNTGLFLRANSGNAISYNDPSLSVRFSDETSPTKYTAALKLSMNTSFAPGADIISNSDVTNASAGCMAITTSVPGTFYVAAKAATNNEGDIIKFIFDGNAVEVTAKNLNASSGDGALGNKYEYAASKAGTFIFGSTAVGVNVFCVRFVPSYTFKATAGNNGSIKVMKGENDVTAAVAAESGATYAYGTTLVLTPKPTNAETHEFDKWTTDGTTELATGDDISIDATTHVLTVNLKSNLTVQATFKEKTAQTTYTVTGEPDDGNGNKVEASPTSAAAGETITLTITTATNYTLTSISAKDSNEGNVELTGEGNTRTFTMPASNVTVTATFAKSSTTDISGATVTLSESSFIYDGEPHTPTEITVNLKGLNLTLSTDYTVEKTSETNVGTYTVIVTGKGNYTGEAKANWTIKRNLGVKLDGTQKWATYYAAEDLEAPTGVTVYKVTEVSGTTVTVDAVGYIKAYTGVLLYSESAVNADNLIVGPGSGENYTSTLSGLVDEGTMTDGTNYILYNNQFILAEDKTLPANHCYLQIPGVSGTRSLTIEHGDDNTTGIHTTRKDQAEMENDKYYTLSGQRVEKPTKKGLYIKNGRKVVVK